MIESGAPAGYIARIHRALSRPQLLAGAPRHLFVGWSFTCAVVGFWYMAWGTALIWLVGWLVMVYLTKRDPQFIEVALEHLKYRLLLTRSQRPGAGTSTWWGRLLLGLWARIRQQR